MSACVPPYTDENSCVIIPACAGTPYVPAHYATVPILDWNAGADSITVLNGDLSLVFTQPTGVVGVIVGIKPVGQPTTVPSLITHGLYFATVGDTFLAQVVEKGQVIGATFTYAATDSFEIRRSTNKVLYLQNNVVIYESVQLSTGYVVVNSCLYASGDQAPDNASSSLVPNFSYTIAAPPQTPYQGGAPITGGTFVTLADTSTGLNVAWRIWSFTGLTPVMAIPQQPLLFENNELVYVPLISGVPFSNVFVQQLVHFSATGSVGITLTIVDTLGNTASTTQTYTVS